MIGTEPIPLPSLDAERWPAFVIDPAGVLVLVNVAWDRVAAGAGGPRAAEAVGTRWLDHISGDDLRTFYAELFQRVAAGGPGEWVTAPCNTPERFRTFRERFELLRAPRGSELRGVLVLTTQVGDCPLEEHYRVAPPDPARYRQPSGSSSSAGAAGGSTSPGPRPRGSGSSSRSTSPTSPRA